MGLNEYDKKYQNEQGQKEILAAKADWEAANARGDEAGKAAAHARAEAARNAAGYKSDNWGNYAGPINSGSGGGSKGYSGGGYSGGGSGPNQYTNVNSATVSPNLPGWLQGVSDYSLIAPDLMAQGAPKEMVQQLYDARLYKSNNTPGLEQYANDPLMQEMLNYINAWNDFEYEEEKPEYEDDYWGLSEAQLNKILNRDDFSYDVTTDPLFQQYQQMYQREGDRAMQNTLAEVASGAGGMNSYAITAAQQANDYYNAQMMDKIPELYQLAYQMYLDDKASMVENLGLLQQMSNAQYNRYRDTMNDWYNDKNFAYNYYRDRMGDYQWNKNFNYNQSRDQISDSRYNDELSYNRTQAEKEDAYNRVLDIISGGGTPSQELLDAAGLSAADAAALIASAKSGTSSSRSSGGSVSSSGGSSGSSSSAGGMDYDGLFEAAYNDRHPETFLAQSANYKKYGFSSSSGLVDAYKEWLESKEAAEADRIVNNSIVKLGIGMVNQETVDKLVDAGAVTIGANGYEWASGWNAENYKEKLDKLAYGNLSGTFDPMWWVKQEHD